VVILLLRGTDGVVEIDAVGITVEREGVGTVRVVDCANMITISKNR